MPSLTAIALRVVVADTLIAASYFVLSAASFPGAVPPVVYQISAPSVAQERVTFNAA
jgi:hypothetical protein